MALFCSAKLRDLRQFEFGSNFACYPPFPPRNILVAGLHRLQQKHFQKGVLSKHFQFTPNACQKTDIKIQHLDPIRITKEIFLALDL